MKHIKTVQRHYKEDIVDFTTCDMCKKIIPYPSTYDVDEVRVSHEFGAQYPDPQDRYTTTVSIDLCGKCFDGRLIPWLKEQGCDVHSEES